MPHVLSVSKKNNITNPEVEQIEKNFSQTLFPCSPWFSHPNPLMITRCPPHPIAPTQSPEHEIWKIIEFMCKKLDKEIVKGLFSILYLKAWRKIQWPVKQRCLQMQWTTPSPHLWEKVLTNHFELHCEQHCCITSVLGNNITMFI